ncbi:MAG: flavodoxin-dependent (E)-4-hydroxy-3-methylbut-2-enyl-diphosphate synthase [Candidatus Zapsychrus exili]|nr:flavodoxin-dependent (E)-4-hydroxy-3-methylbut-2-enyl-diphosphate synthase [Candidatus Zapsychrus exili]
MNTKKQKTQEVKIGNVKVGGNNPVVIQSMTNTDTADVSKTTAQIIELIKAGSEIVRITINDSAACQAVPKIINNIRKKGYSTPVVGDFHYNGHILLNKFPILAHALDKYRINPGNVGGKNAHDKNFEKFIKIAIKTKKPIRIGVNGGSLDKNLFEELKEKNSRLKRTKTEKEVWRAALVESAIRSAKQAINLGLPKNKIILSVKASELQDLVAINRSLSKLCDHPIHVGLTEAGSDLEGISSSAAALGILLNEGIGDTIRVSLTPQPKVSRAREVEVCKAIVQSLGLRHFEPKVTSCPGCGRTDGEYFQMLADDIKKHIKKNVSRWRKKYPGIEKIRIAVMGCIVNGPGESKHADIGISLPGKSETPQALVFVKEKLIAKLKGGKIKEKFIKILEDFICQLNK